MELTKKHEHQKADILCCRLCISEHGKPKRFNRFLSSLAQASLNPCPDSESNGLPQHEEIGASWQLHR